MINPPCKINVGTTTTRTGARRKSLEKLETPVHLLCTTQRTKTSFQRSTRTHLQECGGAPHASAEGNKSSLQRSHQANNATRAQNQVLEILEQQIKKVAPGNANATCAKEQAQHYNQGRGRTMPTIIQRGAKRGVCYRTLDLPHHGRFVIFPPADPTVETEKTSL